MNTAKKKTLSWKWITLVILVIAAFLVGRVTVDQHAHEHDAPDESGTTQEYTCSMHPQVRSTDPKDRCPLCGMELIPVPKDEDGDDDGELPRLRVGARAKALMEIQIWPAERRPVEQAVRLLGRVDVDETRLADIVARTDGYIEHLHTRSTWQPVRQGEPIAEIYSPSIVTAFRELMLARESGGSLEAVQARLQRMGVSRDQLVEVMRTGEVPRTFRVVSPVDGVVQVVDAREGEAVTDGRRLVRVVDLSEVWIQLEAYESDLPLLRVDQSVEFTVAALPGRTFAGEVTFIDPVVDDTRRTARLRVTASNEDGALKPGMFATAQVMTAYEAEEDPIIIPASAPLITGRRALVYVRVPDQERPTFEPRSVVLGPRAGDHYIVAEGLNEGELVVVHGQFKIDSELQLRGRRSMMQPEGGRPPGHDHGEDAVVGVPWRSLAEPGDRWPVVDKSDLPEALSAVVGRILNEYLTLQNALSQDDASASAEAGRRLAEMDILELESDLKPIQADLQEIVSISAKLGGLDSLQEMRLLFETISERLIPMLPLLQIEDKLYVMHCPMVFDFRGADWIQNREEIANPYFGASMLRCGEILKTFEGSDHASH